MDVLPVFGRIGSHPSRTLSRQPERRPQLFSRTFWPNGVLESPHCFASEAAPEAAAAFFDPVSGFLGLEGVQYRRGSWHGGTFGRGN